MKQLMVFVPNSAEELQDIVFDSYPSIISLKRIQDIKSVELSNLLKYRSNIVLCDVSHKILTVFNILKLDTAFNISADVYTAINTYSATEIYMRS